MARYVLEVMYDGSAFHGSQIQGDTPTVQLAVNTALATLMRMPIETFGASRTDEGVHALRNYYHFDTELAIKPSFLYNMNAVLPQAVAAVGLYVANKAEFNCRFDAQERAYRYRIYTAKNPFNVGRAYQFPFAINRQLLDATARVILATTDFESFAKRNAQVATHNCYIKESRWEEHGEELHYVVVANRFLRGMVRGLVATQLRLARMGKTVDALHEIIVAKDCQRAYFNVPGYGLYLEEVRYPDGYLTMVQCK